MKRCDLKQGFAFVTFEERSAAERAISEMDGKPLAGGEIAVSWAREKSDDRRGGDRRGGRFDDHRGGDRGGRFQRGGDRREGAGRGGGACFECGKTGHFARNCPNKGSNDRGDRGFGSGRNRSPPKRRFLKKKKKIKNPFFFFLGHFLIPFSSFSFSNKCSLRFVYLFPLVSLMMRTTTNHTS